VEGFISKSASTIVHLSDTIISHFPEIEFRCQDLKSNELGSDVIYLYLTSRFSWRFQVRRHQSRLCMGIRLAARAELKRRHFSLRT